MTNNSREQNGSTPSTIISLRIISTIPTLSCLFNKRRSSFKYDEHATVFLSRSHDIMVDGSLCRISVKHGREIPCILRLINEDTCNSIDNKPKDATIPTVYLSPCLAATLGLHWFHMRDVNTTLAHLETISYSYVAEAQRARIKPIGVLPPTPRFRSCFESSDELKQRIEMDSDEEEAGLKLFFMHQKKDKRQSQLSAAIVSKPKPRQRLLCNGSIFATACDNNGSMSVRFYQVVDIQSSFQQENNIYFISPSTHLTLDSSTLEEGNHSLYTFRLPRPSLVASFLQSIQRATDDISNNKNDNAPSQLDSNKGDEESTKADREKSIDNVRHPSANHVADAFYLAGISAMSHKTCPVCQIAHSTCSTCHHHHIVHIIGGEDNHVSFCIAEAADIVGMRYFRVNGLAAFWAHSNFLQSFCRQTTKKVAPTLTGQLPDKLNGLDAALKIARKSSPCVLHIVGIDEELSPVSGHSADADGRREEEQRILQVIHESMLESACQQAAFSSNSYASTYAVVPQILVAFSSSKPLASGPIMSSLEQNSVSSIAPDAKYARYLWDDDETFDVISPMLVGVCAKDVVFLRKKFTSLWQIESETHLSSNIEQSSSLIVSLMRTLLADLDKKVSLTHATNSSGGSSVPLSSAMLPNMRWEDIGGLSSVRKEIMDAVELPLKYPELFKGSRRSGILLFGPPGTGKTLVAKAVARECKLPFLSIKGPELLGSYVGESEANVRAVFAAARDAAASTKTHLSLGTNNHVQGGSYGGASVLFFDELDSLAPRRGETGHGDGVMERVVATLLSELDNGTSTSGDIASASSSNRKGLSPHIIVIGATNRPDLLDPSLLRPGRFDRLLYLGPAKTKEACMQILLAQTRKFKFQDDCEKESVLQEAMQSFPPTLSGADLSAVASGALMLALKRVCGRVEDEAKEMNLRSGVKDTSHEVVDVNDVMESWSYEQLQPIVLAEDFIRAAQDIVPSISEHDLERFESLRNQFSAVV